MAPPGRREFVLVGGALTREHEDEDAGCCHRAVRLLQILVQVESGCQSRREVPIWQFSASSRRMLALVAAAAAARPDAPAAALAALDADFARPDAPSSALAALDADLARLDHLIDKEREMQAVVADLSQPFVATFQAVANAAKSVGMTVCTAVYKYARGRAEARAVKPLVDAMKKAAAKFSEQLGRLAIRPGAGVMTVGRLLEKPPEEQVAFIEANLGDIGPDVAGTLREQIGAQCLTTATNIDALSTEMVIRNPVLNSWTGAMYIDGDGNARRITVSDEDDGSPKNIQQLLAGATAEAQRVQKANAANLAEALMAQFNALSMLAGINTPQGRQFAGFIFADEAAAQGLLAEHVAAFLRSSPVYSALLQGGADEEPTVVDVTES